MADPLRLQIIRALQSGPLSVSDLGLALDSEIRTISHHLRVLFHADLVTTARDGKFIYYSLNQEILDRRHKSSGESLDFGCCQFNFPKK